MRLGITNDAVIKQVDNSDFNSLIWISEKDYDALKVAYFGNPSWQFIFSGVTIPFKYRPATDSHASSILNGDLNLGTFLGPRLAFGDKGGVSFGGYFGVASLPMNAANNTGITGNKSESIAGFNYGGGIVFDWQKKFQVGFVLGYDNAVGDLSKTYLYQNRHWFALSLNYSFLDFKGKPTKQNQ